MEILAHRGIWKNTQEKNSYKAITGALVKSFGVEIDLRDYNGKVVISHDIPSQEVLYFEDILIFYNEQKLSSTMALNIKADGLCYLLKGLLSKYSIKEYFVFDMSIPDNVEYKNIGINFYTRKSEYESCVLIDFANGIWIDELDAAWMSYEKILSLVKYNKKLCFVSAEIHHRPNENQWKMIKQLSIKCPDIEIMLCTDKPDDARAFFK